MSQLSYLYFYYSLHSSKFVKTIIIIVANDEDGYEGIQFCRWVADIMAKKENIDLEKFK